MNQFWKCISSDCAIIKQQTFFLISFLKCLDILKKFDVMFNVNDFEDIWKRFFGDFAELFCINSESLTKNTFSAKTCISAICKSSTCQATKIRLWNLSKPGLVRFIAVIRTTYTYPSNISGTLFSNDRRLRKCKLLLVLIKWKDHYCDVCRDFKMKVFFSGFSVRIKEPFLLDADGIAELTCNII